MKSKFSRILGVGLSIAVLASMIVVTTPASAGTLTPSNEFSPPTRAGAQIMDMAVAGNGSTVYVAGGTSDLSGIPGNGTQLLAKSVDGGTTWSSFGTRIEVGNPAVIGNLPATTVSVDKVAIAPDTADGSFIAILATDNSSGSNVSVVYISADGGATFQAASSATSPISSNKLSGIDIAGPSGGSSHSIVVTDGVGIWTLDIGGILGGSWTARTTAAGFDPGSVLAVKFSPQYASDHTIAAVTANASQVEVQFFNTVATSPTQPWNGTMYAGAPQKVSGITGVPAFTPVAAIDIPSTFFGLDPSSRMVYVGVADDGVVGARGLYRVAAGVPATQLSTVNANSVDLNAAGDKLVAGAYDSNDVVRVATPASALGLSGLSATANKRPAGAGPETKMVVRYAGTNVLAGGQGNESAISRSADDGKDFNDVSLVNVGATNTPVAFDTSADGAKIYVVANDGYGFTSVWRKTTAWERVFTIATPTTSGFVVDASPDNADVVYLANVGSTQMFYTNDGGQTTWQFRFPAAAVTDMAVESATTVDVLAANFVYKTTDSGYNWTPTTLTFTGATINVLSAGNVIVGGSTGQVAYSTNSTWTTLAAPVTGGGTTFVTASGLASGNFIYATTTASTNVYRWTIGTSTSWAPMMTSALLAPPTGIALSSGVLYVTACNPTTAVYPASAPTAKSVLYRTLTPSTAAVDGDWTFVGLNDTTTPGASTTSPFVVVANDTPQALKAIVVSNQPKLYFIDTSATRLESWTDAVVSASPALTAPADKFIDPINMERGTANDIVFQWSAVAGAPPTATYTLQIALDSAFKQPVFTQAGLGTLAIVGPTGQSVVNGVAGVATVWQFQADTTYYWRVKLSAPVDSPWAAGRSFKIDTLAPLTIQAPAPGATNVSVTPTFVWSAAPGATTYEIVVSDDPTFAIITFSRTTNQPVFAADEQLAYNTVYYWRVRASAPATAVTTYATGVFTTEPRPVTTTPGSTTPAITITQTQTTITVQPGVEPIPTYLLWIIIGVGAVLVISLIVLIVRTRRVS